MTTGLIIALIVSFAFNVLCAVLVFTERRRSTDALERSHERTTEYTKDLLDRLGARDWQHYLDETRPPIVIEEVEPDTELRMVPTLGPDRGGFGSRHGLRAWDQRDEAAELAEEDMQ